MHWGRFCVFFLLCVYAPHCYRWPFAQIVKQNNKKTATFSDFSLDESTTVCWILKIQLFKRAPCISMAHWMTLKPLFFRSRRMHLLLRWLRVNFDSHFFMSPVPALVCVVCVCCGFQLWVQPCVSSVSKLRTKDTVVFLHIYCSGLIKFNYMSLPLPVWKKGEKRGQCQFDVCRLDFFERSISACNFFKERKQASEVHGYNVCSLTHEIAGPGIRLMWKMYPGF